MQLNTLDWWVVVACLAAAFAPALWFARRAGKGTAEFFASGRSAPWWLIGTSMVATTFSTDTPNLVTDLVRSGGVAANWAWWAFLITGMSTVFLYARLWRRSGVLTDLEFYELRYSGRPAAAVRGVRAIYLGLVFNAVIMAAVTLAAVKIAHVLLGWERSTTLLVCFGLSVGFSVLAGLWGVLVADLVQFVIAMIGVIAAARAALAAPQVGGLSGLVERLDPKVLSFFPDPGDGSVFVSLLVVPLAVQWWAVWYPGSEPGGGSYIAQRMLAAKDESHALKAVLWFNVAHYALRPWPWILVALASLLGLLVASLTSAYVSTMSTHLNWGASYLVHDFYRRFMRPDAGERHLVAVSRLVTVGLMGCAVSFTLLLETAGEAFRLLLSFGAGTGLIYLLRWYWWRINAWSEISAMVVSFLVTLAIHLMGRAGVVTLSADAALLWTVGTTTAVWLAMTWLTPAVDPAVLTEFVRRIRPAGPGWGPFRVMGAGPTDPLPQALLSWALGCMTVYAALFATGSLLYGRTGRGLVLAGIAVMCGIALARLMSRSEKSDPGHDTP